MVPALVSFPICRVCVVASGVCQVAGIRYAIIVVWEMVSSGRAPAHDDTNRLHP